MQCEMGGSVSVAVAGKVLWPDCNPAVTGFLHFQRPGGRLQAQSLAIDPPLACARCGGHLQRLGQALGRL